MKPNWNEQRRGIRAKRILSVRHRLYKRKGKTVQSPWYISTTENMSICGLLFHSSAEYVLGDIVELNITMSGILDVFRGYGKVVRVGRKKGAPFFSVAVDYVALKPKRRKAKNFKARNRITAKKTTARK